MSSAIVLNDKFEKSGELALPEKYEEINSHNLHLYVKSYLAALRANTASTKTRSEVSGGGKKPWSQKGRGGARAGSRTNPVWVGGGIAFGPQPHDWYRKIPKKKKRLALKLALTEKANAGEVIVVESFDMEKPNTKFASNLISSLVKGKKRALVLVDSSDPAIVKSFSNLPYVSMNRADSTFAYEVLNAGCLILTEDALNKMVEVFA